MPGVYRRGTKFVVVYRADRRQHKQYADTLGEARAIRLQRDGEARAQRHGPTLHEFSLSWLDRYAGIGHDSVRENTRREYRRLLVNFALTSFDRAVRVRDLDRRGCDRSRARRRSCAGRAASGVVATLPRPRRMRERALRRRLLSLVQRRRVADERSDGRVGDESRAFARSG